MDFKEWLKPRVLISGGAGLLLAFLISWFLLNKSVATTPCQPTSGPLWIDLSSTSGSFSTVVCAKQVIGWMDNKQATVTFKNNSCLNQLTYTVNQDCPGLPGYKCSQTTHIKQPGSIFSTAIGWCDYDLGGGLKDPRVIVIGK